MGLPCPLPAAGPGCSPWRLEVSVQVSAARSDIFTPFLMEVELLLEERAWKPSKLSPLSLSLYLFISYLFFLFITPVFQERS